MLCRRDIIYTIKRKSIAFCGGDLAKQFRMLVLKSGGPLFKSSILPLFEFLFDSP